MIKRNLCIHVPSASNRLDGFDIVVDRATPKKPQLDNFAVQDELLVRAQTAQQATVNQADCLLPESCSSRGLEALKQLASTAQSSLGRQFDDQIRLLTFLQQQQEYMEQTQIHANRLPLDDMHCSY